MSVIIKAACASRAVYSLIVSLLSSSAIEALKSAFVASSNCELDWHSMIASANFSSAPAPTSRL